MFFGLVDCNNFFVSCERLFNPDLNGRPVVVLSNNDGCAVSRSNEAKALGIPMGCPAFKIKEYTSVEVITISGNHTLYNDISHRIMYLLGKEVENIQVYSVDEAFFTINCSDPNEAYREAEALAYKIKHDIGIPVSVGISHSKTLAKIASHIAKKTKSDLDNTYALITQRDIMRALLGTPIEDVWGIGRRLSKDLHKYHVNTAHDFMQLPSSFISSQYSIVTERVKRELMGESCTDISPIDRAKQSIMTSRSFGRLVTDKTQITDAVVNFASNCCKLLRQQNSVAESVTVYIRGDINQPQLPFYSNKCELHLQYATCDTMEIVNNAIIALDFIYRAGYSYKKAGVILGDISDAGKQQLNIFHSGDEQKHKKLMSAIDNINMTNGSNTISLASANGSIGWHPRKEHESKASNVLHIYSGMITPDDASL